MACKEGGSPRVGGKMPEAISSRSRQVTLAGGSILSVLLISKAYLLCFRLPGHRPIQGHGWPEPFACAIIYFAAFLRYCFVRANNCDIINDPTVSHSLLRVDAAKLISKSFISITPVLELCTGTKAQEASRHGGNSTKPLKDQLGHLTVP